VFVDGTLIIDKFIDQSATTYTATRTLTAGAHDIKVEYYEALVDAVAKVSWAAAGSQTVNLSFASAPSGLQLTVGGTTSTTPFTRTVTQGSTVSVSAPSPQTLSGTSYTFSSWSDGGAATHNIVANAAATYTATYTAGGGGTCTSSQYQAQYFSNRTLTGSPVLTRCENAINNDWGQGGPGAPVPVDDFSARWTGTFTFPAGDTTFTATADDGIRVFVDGTLIIDKFIDQSATTYTATRTLTAGAHDIKVEYYEHNEDAVAKASWTTP
jgi:PA14 domain